jgi:hypothetical protein
MEVSSELHVLAICHAQIAPCIHCVAGCVVSEEERSLAPAENRNLTIRPVVIPTEPTRLASY